MKLKLSDLKKMKLLLLIYLDCIWINRQCGEMKKEMASFKRHCDLLEGLTGKKSIIRENNEAVYDIVEQVYFSRKINSRDYAPLLIAGMIINFDFTDDVLLTDALLDKDFSKSVREAGSNLYYKYCKNKVQKTFSEVAQELLENMPQIISELLESSGVSKQEIDYMLIKHKQHISNGFAKGIAIFGKGIDHDLEKPQEKPTSKTSNKNDNLAIIEVIMRKKNLSKAEALEYAIDNGLME